MSQQNVEVVQRVLEHFMATGEPDWGTLDEEFEVSDHDTPDQGDYRGHEGFGRWLEEWGAAWANWSFEPEEFIDAGDRIVAVIRMKTEGRDSGIETEQCASRDGEREIEVVRAEKERQQWDDSAEGEGEERRHRRDHR